MNKGKFNDSLRWCHFLLKSLKLVKQEYIPRTMDYSDDSKALAQSETSTYQEIYNTAVNNLDYEFAMTDDSLLQLYLNGNIIRYAFIQNPIQPLSFLDFLRENFEDKDIPKDEDKLNELQSELQDDYEQRLNDQRLNEKAIYLRYDLDQTGYRPRVHSYAHLHVGLNQNFRIPVHSIITPLSFVITIIKWLYPSYWMTFLGDSELTKQFDNYKGKNENMKDAMWHNSEFKDLFLG